MQLHYGLKAVSSLRLWSLVDDGKLEEHADQNTPGQLWTEYKSTSNDTGELIAELGDAAGLLGKLQDLLQQSESFQEVEDIYQREFTTPLLKLKEKRLKSWHAEDITNGAHFPLCVYTHNRRARSSEAKAKRLKQFRDLQQGGDAVRH